MPRLFDEAAVVTEYELQVPVVTRRENGTTVLSTEAANSARLATVACDSLLRLVPHSAVWSIPDN